MAERFRFICMPINEDRFTKRIHMMNEYKSTVPDDSSISWMRASCLHEDPNWEATGRTWELDNRSGKSVTYVEVALLQAPASRSRDAVAKEDLLNKACYAPTLWIWPVIGGQADLDLLWATRRNWINHFHRPLVKQTCVYCTDTATTAVVTPSLWNYDPQLRLLRVTVLLMRACYNYNDCAAFQSRMARSFESTPHDHGLVPARPAFCQTCDARSRPGSPKLLVCSGCWIAHYCSKTCQERDWPVHRAICTRISHWDAMEDSYEACGLSMDAIWGTV